MKGELGVGCVSGASGWSWSTQQEERPSEEPRWGQAGLQKDILDTMFIPVNSGKTSGKSSQGMSCIRIPDGHALLGVKSRVKMEGNGRDEAYV